jgi:hypothetical protein
MDERRGGMSLAGSISSVVLLLSVVSAGLSFQTPPPYEEQRPPSTATVYRELGSVTTRLDDHAHRLEVVETRDVIQAKRLETLERTSERMSTLVDNVSDTFKKLLIGIISGVVLMFVRMYVTTKQLHDHRAQVQSDIDIALTKFLGIPSANEPPPVIGKEYNARSFVDKIRRAERPRSTKQPPEDTD